MKFNFMLQMYLHINDNISSRSIYIHTAFALDMRRMGSFMRVNLDHNTEGTPIDGGIDV